MTYQFVSFTTMALVENELT